MPIRRPAGAGGRPHWITLEGPGGPPVPDGDGGFIESPAPLDPPGVFARIRPATGTDLERTVLGTVVAGATHIVLMPYHPGVTTHTTIHFEGRVFNVAGVASPEEGKVDTVCLCTEALP